MTRGIGTGPFAIRSCEIHCLHGSEMRKRVSSRAGNLKRSSAWVRKTLDAAMRVLGFTTGRTVAFATRQWLLLRCLRVVALQTMLTPVDDGTLQVGCSRKMSALRP